VGNRWDTGRTEAFSDGVFAIAITLLVLDIHVPVTEFHHLWAGIGHEWPSYLGYATSFAAVGGLWLAHHGVFRRMRYANDRVMRINLLLLMAVSFLPFPTSLVAQTIRSTNAERAAVIFYGASLLVIRLLFSALWASVASDRQLLKPDVSEREVAEVQREATPNIGFYVAATGLALVAPRAAAFVYLAIALLGILRVRGDSEAETADASTA
jgi:uncharacterized membrane protein